jgi:hypothetical protein
MKNVVQNFKPTPFAARNIYFSSFQGQANAVGLSQVNDIFLRLVVCSGCFVDNKQAFTSFSKLHDDKKSSTQFSR